MMKYVALFFIIFVSPHCYAGDCDALDKKNCSVLKNFTVADTNKPLHFEHLCSDLDHHNGHNRGAYAFFESRDKGLKALVLAEVFVGHIGWIGKGELKGIWLDLEKMRVKSLKGWAGSAFSLALRIKNTKTNQTVTGEFLKTFSYSHAGSGYPEDQKYTLSKTGEINWEKLIEPEEEKKQESATEAGADCISCLEPGGGRKKNEYKDSKGIYVRGDKMTHLKDPHVLYLVLKNEKTGAEISLQGPVLKNPHSYLDIEYSGPRVLTWEVLMPGQEGGLWDYIFDAFRYGDCIYLRKQAKKEFSARFADQ